MAKRKTLFDDRPVEISELTYVIKQDLASLNQQIASLSALTQAQHPKINRSKTDQEGEHNDNVSGVSEERGLGPLLIGARLLLCYRVNWPTWVPASKTSWKSGRRISKHPAQEPRTLSPLYHPSRRVHSIPNAPIHLYTIPRGDEPLSLEDTKGTPQIS